MNKKLPQGRDTNIPPKSILKIKDRIFKVVLIVLLISLTISVQAQEKITGLVRDSSGPLAGVGVQIKGTKVSTLTDGNGKFMIALSGTSKAVLVFSFIGYQTQELSAVGNQVLEVTMLESTSDLNEVVVVGYGTQRKQDLTGAVSVVKASDVKKRQATTVAESLQGLATGIRVLIFTHIYL